MAASRVPVRELIHSSREVLARVEAGERIEISRHGKVIAVLTPPDAAEVKLDELAEAGLMASDWRERQAALRRALPQLSVLRATPTRGAERAGSEAILADREESER